MPRAVRFPRRNFLMRASKFAQQVSLAILLCAVAALCCCGREKTAPLSETASNAPPSADATLAEPPLDQQTVQKLDPLTKEDVELYLRVMRAAAERVENLTPADQAALDGARKILACSASRRTPTRDDAKTLERATLVAVSMDQIVAQEMKLDG